jgi:hypothetical protein
MPDFWRASGFHLLERNAEGHLAVTEEFLRAYLSRPEISPVAESCAAERNLHQALMDDPRLVVPAGRLDEIADPDAGENYRLLLDFRDRLLAANTVEGCYLSAFRSGQAALPPLFIDQMAHVILRNILDGISDPLQVRAAELLFRLQTVTVADGSVMLADAETVEMHAATGGLGDLGALVVDAQTPLKTIELDVLNEDNADLYWQRDERHDTVLNVTFAQPGLDALCRVLEAWVAHFLDVRVRVQPVQQISDEAWVWHVGLDAEATALLNDLYNEEEVEEESLDRLLALFRLEFEDPDLMQSEIAGRPVYLAMAMTPTKLLHLKPQNLLVSLPLAAQA